MIEIAIRCVKSYTHYELSCLSMYVSCNKHAIKWIKLSMISSYLHGKIMAFDFFQGVESLTLLEKLNLYPVKLKLYECIYY